MTNVINITKEEFLQLSLEEAEMTVLELDFKTQWDHIKYLVAQRPETARTALTGAVRVGNAAMVEYLIYNYNIENTSWFFKASCHLGFLDVAILLNQTVEAVHPAAECPHWHITEYFILHHNIEKDEKTRRYLLTECVHRDRVPEILKVKAEQVMLKQEIEAGHNKYDNRHKL